MPKVEDGASPAWEVPSLPTWLERAETARRWLMPGFLPEESLVLLSGQKKRANKTLTAMGTAIAMATGKPFGLWTPTEAVPVIFAEQEGAMSQTRTRILAIAAGMGVEPASLGRLYFSFHDRIKLESPLWRTRLVGKVRELGARLVILDALVYMHGADENRTNEMLPVVETVQELRNAGATVMYLAHLDKTRGGDRNVDIDDQVRGTGLLTDAYDCHEANRRYKMGEPIQVVRRFRDGEEQHWIAQWDFESDEDGELKWAAVRYEDPNAAHDDLVRRCLEKMELGTVLLKESLQERWQLTQKLTSEVLAQLIEEGDVQKAKGGGYVRITKAMPDK